MPEYISVDSEQLIKFIDGDEKAFAAIYDVYHTGLDRFVKKYVQNEGTAEDLVHDIFIKLWEARKHINPSMQLNNYLYRICRNHIFKYLKKQQKTRLLKQELAHIDPNAGFIQTAADEPLIEKEYDRFFHQAVAELSPQRQRVFRLCRMEGKTYDETASLLGISSYTVKEHMVLAMRFIKEYLSKNANIVFTFLFLANFCLS